MRALIWELRDEEEGFAIALVHDLLLTCDTTRGSRWQVAVFNGNPAAAHAEGVRMTEHWQKVLPTLLGPNEIDVSVAAVQQARQDIDPAPLVASFLDELDKMHDVV